VANPRHTVPARAPVARGIDPSATCTRWHVGALVDGRTRPRRDDGRRVGVVVSYIRRVPPGRRVGNRIASTAADDANSRSSMRCPTHNDSIGTAMKVDADLFRLGGVEASVVPVSRLRNTGPRA